MPRPAKISPSQWTEIERRAAVGESVRSLAKEFGVTEAALRFRGISTQTSQVRSVAEQLAAAQSALAGLPVPQQHLAVQLAEALREVSSNLAGAARYGTATALRLTQAAHQSLHQAGPIDEETLRSVSMLTRTANDAAQVGLTLLKANEDAMRDSDAQAQRLAKRVTRVEIVPMALSDVSSDTTQR
jgi:hypothetical protein